MPIVRQLYIIASAQSGTSFNVWFGRCTSTLSGKVFRDGHFVLSGRSLPSREVGLLARWSTYNNACVVSTAVSDESESDCKDSWDRMVCGIMRFHDGCHMKHHASPCEYL